MESFSALLLCNDPVSLGISQRVLEEYGFSVKTPGAAIAAEQLLKSSKFDLAIYDNDIPCAMDLALPSRSPNAPRIVFAMVRNATGAGMRGKRIHFIVQKPFTPDLFGRTLRAAFGVMLKDRRVAFRHPVVIQSAGRVVRDEGSQKLANTTILDISRTGLCFQGSEMVPQGATVQLRFQLPETKHLLNITGIVMWTRASGRAGVKFSAVEEQKILNDWLDTRVPFDQPELVPRPVAAQAVS